MNACNVLSVLWEHGLQVSLKNGADLEVSPASALRADLRALIRSNKTDIVTLLAESKATAAALMEAAMRVCDNYGDDDPKREVMRQDILSTPLHLRPELLDYFNGKTTPLH